MAFRGKVALVTGAAMGIGRAMSEELLKNGAKVALLDINVGAGKTLMEALEKEFGKDKTLFIECDVQNEEQIKAAFQKTVDTFGGLDIVCNNAGIFDEANVEKTVSINLLGMIRVAYVALDYMNKQTGGHGGVIVSTASTAGLDPFPTCPVYVATKYGIIGFTRSMALASLSSEYGVRFNVLCPSAVDTDLPKYALERLGRFSHMKEEMENITKSLGSMHVSAVSEGLMELLSDETKTGQALIIMPNERKYVEFPTHI